MSSPTTIDPATAQQTLQVLEAIKVKVLLEMWTSIMLVGGALAILLAQISHIFGLRRIAALLVCLFGYSMTWVPAAVAPYIGYIIIFCSIAVFLRESISFNAPGQSTASPSRSAR